MNVLVYAGHPAHVHLFKNIIRRLETNGHNVIIAAIDKEFTTYLLEIYGFKYKVIGKHYKRLSAKILSLGIRDYKLLRISKKFEPDLFVSHGSMYASHVAKIMNKPHISLEDTELSMEQIRLYAPFTDVILTPACFRLDLGKKQVRYDGYHEISYLHPNYFTPSTEVLDELGLSKNDKYIIVRFISWGASHDVGLRGIRKGTEMEFIKTLEKYGQVFVSSEKKIDRNLEKYRISVSPEKIHSLLYYAQLYIGEGGTMATEAAILGTPSIHIESTSSGVASGEFTGNFLELRNRYGLLFFYSDQNQALNKAIGILEDKTSKRKWRKKRDRLIEDKIDVTAWITDFIERYPESYYEYRDSCR